MCVGGKYTILHWHTKTGERGKKDRGVGEMEV